MEDKCLNALLSSKCELVAYRRGGRAESEEEIDEDIQGKTADFKSNCSKGAWWKAAKDL